MGRVCTSSRKFKLGLGVRKMGGGKGGSRGRWIDCCWRGRVWGMERAVRGEVGVIAEGGIVGRVRGVGGSAVGWL